MVPGRMAGPNGTRTVVLGTARTPFGKMGGALSSLDAPALNGAKLKAKEINDAGGVLGKKIELVVYDTKTDPTVIAIIIAPFKYATLSFLRAPNETSLPMVWLFELSFMTI